MSNEKRSMSGFTLISTLFLLVVVSSLAAYLVNLSTAQHFSSAVSINAVRARHAALSGLEWVAYRIGNVSNTCPPIPSAMTVEGFAVTLDSCSASDILEGGVNYRLYDVTVSAQRGAFGDADYINLAIRANLRG